MVGRLGVPYRFDQGDIMFLDFWKEKQADGHFYWLKAKVAY